MISFSFKKLSRFIYFDALDYDIFKKVSECLIKNRFLLNIVKTEKKKSINITPLLEQITRIDGESREETI